MAREKHHFHYDSFRNLKGFTLVELMIGVALAGIIVAVLFQLLTSQNRTYLIQDDMAEMQQNLRVAIERISRELMTAGLGQPPWSGVNGCGPTPWSGADGCAGYSWYDPPNGQSTPYNITSSGSNNTIDIIGCVDSTVSRLSADAPLGAVTITLTAEREAISMQVRGGISTSGVWRTPKSLL